MPEQTGLQSYFRQLPCARLTKTQVIVIFGVVFLLTVGTILGAAIIKNKINDQPLNEEIISDRSILNLELSLSLSRFDYLLIVVAVLSLLGFVFVVFRYFKSQTTSFIRRQGKSHS